MGSFALLASLVATLALLFKDQHVLAFDNGVGRLPVMGYNSLSFGCNVTQDIMRMSAERLVSLGLRDIGYTYVNFDTCWAETNRSATGDLVADSARFPFGLNVLTDEIHGLGMKAGIYGGSGWFFCNNEPGSFQNEVRDITQYHNWGFDYLKLVDCAVPYDNITREGVVGKFQRTADAIAQVAQSTGSAPLVYSISEPGDQFPYLWGPRMGQSWRTTHNVKPTWSSIASVINQNSFISWASDYYGHNDMDLLQIGQGDLTLDETKTHFTAWALMKSPLLISTDLSQISQQNLNILKNAEIIAINQDPVVGEGVTPFRWGANPYWTSDPTRPAQYWSGETQNGTVFMLINTLDQVANMFFNLTESPWIRAGRQYSVRDLWAHADLGVAVRNYTARAVPAHGVVALLLQDAGDEPANSGPACARAAQCVSESGVVAPGT